MSQSKRFQECKILEIANWWPHCQEQPREKCDNWFLVSYDATLLLLQGRNSLRLVAGQVVLFHSLFSGEFWSFDKQVDIEDNCENQCKDKWHYVNHCCFNKSCSFCKENAIFSHLKISDKVVGMRAKSQVPPIIIAATTRSFIILLYLKGGAIVPLYQLLLSQMTCCWHKWNVTVFTTDELNRLF